MSLPQVKICGMTRPEDVEVALREGADYLGFILYPKSPRYVTLAQAQSLFSGSDHPPSQKVAVAVDPDPDNLVRWMDAGFEYFQIQGFVIILNPHHNKSYVMEYNYYDKQ